MTCKRIGHLPSKVWCECNIMNRIKHNPYNTVDILPLPVIDQSGQNTYTCPVAQAQAYITYKFTHLVSSLYSKICNREDATAPGSSIPTTIIGGWILIHQHVLLHHELQLHKEVCKLTEDSMEILIWSLKQNSILIGGQLHPHKWISNLLSPSINLQASYYINQLIVIWTTNNYIKICDDHWLTLKDSTKGNWCQAYNLEHAVINNSITKM